MSTMLAAQGERLARWHAAHEIDVISVRREVAPSHVVFYDFPVSNVPDPGLMISSQRGAGVGIPFHDDLVLKSSLSGAQGETTGPGE